MPAAAYRFETLEEAEERRSRSAAQERSGQQNMWRGTSLDGPRTYTQQVLAEHEAASARQSSNRYPFQDKHTEEPTESSRRHFRVISTDDIPSRHTRTTLLSTKSLASTHSRELRGEFACETRAYRDMPQEHMHGLETACDGSKPATPRPRLISVSATPSEMWLDNHNSPALDREVHQSAAL